MKKLIALSALVLLSVVAAMAQTSTQDVIYLKNGSMYRGSIIEQVPNQSYKIEISGGSVIAVQVSEIERITKEKLPETNTSWGCGMGWGRRDTSAFVPRKRGYFNVAQVLIENKQGGVRLVNGFKFGRLGYLGIGVGFDRVFESPFNERINGLEKEALRGYYFPLYLYYAGDIRQKRLTPYYAFEAGYAMAYRGFDNEVAADGAGRRPLGGAMGGFGMGLKWHPTWAKGRHVSLLFNINYKMVRYEEDVLLINNLGQVMGRETSVATANLLFPGIRLGIGF